MKLLSFEHHGSTRIGAWRDQTVIVDLTASGFPDDLSAFIALGEPAWNQARQLIGARNSQVVAGPVRILAPIGRPRRNIFCIGKNYVAHAKEFQGSGFDAASPKGEDIPDQPIVFTKAPTAVIGPDDPIPSGLDPTSTTDYEGELAVVIGKPGRQIRRATAIEHVFGYTIVNDVTSRDLQRLHKQWFLGKSIDGFCPMGPSIVTADEIGDCRRLTLTTRVNGEPRQEASVADLIFDVPTLIETISRGITLQAGDVIATGTPAGVGIGFNPPKFLRPGDRVSITIEPIGTLENPVG